MLFDLIGSGDCCRIDFHNGFFLYTLLSDGSALAPVDNFDSEWAEVEFGDPISQTSILTVSIMKINLL